MGEQIEKLTKELALQEVEKIREISYDDETAHSMEDDLHQKFISCVAKGMYKKDEVIEIANIVKSTLEIKFSRWYA